MKQLIGHLIAELLVFGFTVLWLTEAKETPKISLQLLKMSPLQDTNTQRL